MIYFCADLCKNHGQSLAVAREMVREAAAAGADIVKLQSDDGLLEGHSYLIESAIALGLKVAVTVRTIPDLGYPRYKKVSFWKIGSGECLNGDLIEAVRATRKPWIISTGACTAAQADEIYRRCPTIMCECTSSYPNEAGEIRLGYLRELVKRGEAAGLSGYSDHMPNYHMSLAAVALGAQYVEKHLSLTPKAEGANHSSSIGPEDFGRMVWQGREIAAALENTDKSVLPRELSTGKLTEYRNKRG